MVQGIQKKHEEEHDPILERVAKIQEYLQKNKNKLLVAIVVIFAVAAAAGLSYKSSVEKNNKMAAEVGIANNDFANTDYELTIERLSESVENYHGTDASGLGMMYLASSYYRIGEYENSRDSYLECAQGGADNDYLIACCYSGAAMCSEKLDEYDLAIKYYKNAAEHSPFRYFKHQNLASLAKIYLVQENVSEAESILEKVKLDDPTPKLKNEITFLLASMQ
ncbi:hypothetical protein H8D59_01335 [bacterium]|nr:hypothetical protein [bacterium]